MRNHRFQKIVSLLVSASLMVLPVSSGAFPFFPFPGNGGGGGFSPFPFPGNGGGGGGNPPPTTPPGNGGSSGAGSGNSGSGSSVSNSQPDVLIILDNSQGMAGSLQGVSSYATVAGGTPVLQNALSGAIMTGSGAYGINTTSSSPPYYSVAGFTPPAYGTATGVNPYTLNCGIAGLSQSAQAACNSIGNQGQVDNSPSMLNAAETSLISALNSTDAQNIQFGLETFDTYNNSLYNTWVYYMSGSYGFSFQPTSGATEAVTNPCYENWSSYSCQEIQNWAPYGSPLSTYQLYYQPNLYIDATSDAPDINDVYYADYSPGYGESNIVNQGPNPSSLAGFTLQDYETQNIAINYSSYSNPYLSSGSPTSAGYVAFSPEVWYSLRGYGYNASVKPDTGSILVPLSSNDSANIQSIDGYLGPETFPAGSTITASAGYSPTAGAFVKALSYLNSLPQNCLGKYVIFVTDGQPTMDTSGNVFPPLGSVSGQYFYGESYQITASNWQSSPDKAVVEAIQEIQQLNDAGIKTYVLGVGTAVDPNAVTGESPSELAEAQQGHTVLNLMAQAGGTGSALSALNQTQITAALSGILGGIRGATLDSALGNTAVAQSGDYTFATLDLSQATGQGNLNAYQLTQNGNLNSPSQIQTAWDANSIMGTGNRASAIVTTANPGTGFASGSETTLTNMAANDPWFFYVANGGPSAATIAQYTINPSYDGGAYLGGRENGWYLGIPSGSTPVVVTPPDNANYLNDPGYTTWAANHSNRQDAVLFSMNDGMLYAVGYNNTSTPDPTLLWAWMPQGFLSSLQNYKTFWQQPNMAGSVSEVDAANSQGTWHSYVLGSAESGGILYDLQLSGTQKPGLANTVAEYDLDTLTGNSWSSPINGSPGLETIEASYLVNGNTDVGDTAAIWSETETLSGGQTQSGLMILDASTGSLTFVPAPKTLTSQPVVGPNGTVYVGAGSDVLSLPAVTVQSIMQSPPAFAGTVGTQNATYTNLGNFANYPSGVSTTINRLRVADSNGQDWMVAQTSQGITAAEEGNGGWTPQWASTTEGAGTYTNGRFTPQSASTPQSQVIQALPSSATITDNARIAGNAVILPLSVPPSSGSCGIPLAEYALFNLRNGTFPNGVFTSTTGTPVTGLLQIGYGTAFTPSITSYDGRPLIQSSASNTNSSKVFQATVTGGIPLGGPQQGYFIW